MTTEVILHQDDIKKGKGVAVATIHSAKGLEWDIVFILRQNQGACPFVWRPHEDEQRQHGFSIPPGYYDSLDILRKWDHRITDGVWPEGVRLSFSVPNHFSFSWRFAHYRTSLFSALIELVDLQNCQRPQSGARSTICAKWAEPSMLVH